MYILFLIDVYNFIVHDKMMSLPLFIIIYLVLMASLGYHIVLEKPMAVTEEDCLKITQV